MSGGIGRKDLARAFWARQFTNTGVDVGTQSTLVLAANPLRRYAAIVNDSDTDIYLSIGQAAQPHAGIRLNAQGGVYEINGTNLHGEAIYAVHAGTGLKRLCVVEGVA